MLLCENVVGAMIQRVGTSPVVFSLKPLVLSCNVHQMTPTMPTRSTTVTIFITLPNLLAYTIRLLYVCVIVTVGEM